MTSKIVVIKRYLAASLLGMTLPDKTKTAGGCAPAVFSLFVEQVTDLPKKADGISEAQYDKE